MSSEEKSFLIQQEYQSLRSESLERRKIHYSILTGILTIGTGSLSFAISSGERGYLYLIPPLLLMIYSINSRNDRIMKGISNYILDTERKFKTIEYETRATVKHNLVEKQYNNYLYYIIEPFGSISSIVLGFSFFSMLLAPSPATYMMYIIFYINWLIILLFGFRVLERIYDSIPPRLKGYLTSMFKKS